MKWNDLPELVVLSRTDGFRRAYTMNTLRIVVQLVILLSYAFFFLHKVLDWSCLSLLIFLNPTNRNEKKRNLSLKQISNWHKTFLPLSYSAIRTRTITPLPPGTPISFWYL